MKLSLLLLPFLLFSQALEVRLPTRSLLKPAYLSEVKVDDSEQDWRFFEELRAVLEFDLNTGGFCMVASSDPDLENRVQPFDIAFWKKRSFALVLSMQVERGQCTLHAFNVEKGTSKQYPEFALTGKIEEDRRLIHRLCDMLHKDLFGHQGIAELRILYTKRIETEKGDFRSEIWVCDADGAGAKKVIEEKGYCLSPGFFPKTGQGDLEFYYAADRDGQSKLYRAFLSQKTGRPFLEMRGNQALPSMNAKGSQIAFISDVAGRPDLFVQNFDSRRQPIGRARQLFSAAKATQASSTYSPDGKQIAFVSDKDGPPRIYTMSVLEAKARPRLLTKRNRENTSPAWSPDGTKLAYSAKTEGVRQIWVYDFKTDEETCLTTGDENKENPAWAPDNLHLVYNTEGPNGSELYLLHLNEPKPQHINKMDGQKRFPVWEPR